MLNKFMKWETEELDTHVKFWQMKMKGMPIITSLYEVLGGDENPRFSVPASFILADLAFKTLPTMLFNKVVLGNDPCLYSLLVGVILQATASIPVVMYKECMLKRNNEDKDDGESSLYGSNMV